MNYLLSGMRGHEPVYQAHVVTPQKENLLVFTLNVLVITHVPEHNVLKNSILLLPQGRQVCPDSHKTTSNMSEYLQIWVSSVFI
jgi:hypothetical protein